MPGPVPGIDVWTPEKKRRAGVKAARRGSRPGFLFHARKQSEIVAGAASRDSCH